MFRTVYLGIRQHWLDRTNDWPFLATDIRLSKSWWSPNMFKLFKLMITLLMNGSTEIFLMFKGLASFLGDKLYSSCLWTCLNSKIISNILYRTAATLGRCRHNVFAIKRWTEDSPKFWFLLWTRDQNIYNHYFISDTTVENIFGIGSGIRESSHRIKASGWTIYYNDFIAFIGKLKFLLIGKCFFTECRI